MGTTYINKSTPVLDHATRGAVVVEHLNLITRVCATVVRSMTGYNTDALVDDCASRSVEILLRSALVAFDGRMPVVSYVKMIAENEAVKECQLHCNSKPHRSWNTTGADSDGMGEKVDGDGFQATTEQAASCAYVKRQTPEEVDDAGVSTVNVRRHRAPILDGEHISRWDDEHISTLDAKRARANLPAAIAQLTADERAFIVACEDAANWGEVAERTGLSAPTVSRRYRAIAAKLRALLEDDE